MPIVDPKSIIQHGLEIAQMSYLTGARELEADKKRRIDELHQDQLDALDATLAMMTGQTPWIGDLEVIPGAEAEVLYAVEDNNPYADRLFGDAKTSIEEMIVATAQKYAGHPGLARAGLNPVEFRIWFQSLVKQEVRVFHRGAQPGWGLWPDAGHAGHGQGSRHLPRLL